MDNSKKLRRYMFIAFSLMVVLALTLSACVPSQGLEGALAADRAIVQPALGHAVRRGAGGADEMHGVKLPAARRACAGSSPAGTTS